MKEEKILPVQYDGEKYFINDEALSDHIETNLAELRQTTLARTDISNKKFMLVAMITVGATGMVTALAFFGATFWAFVIALIFLADVKPILTFLEKDPA